MNWKSTVAASGVGLVGMWLASYAPAGRVGPAPPATLPAAGAETAAADVQREARRLRERLQHVPSYSDPSRNPFRFSARRAPAGNPGTAGVTPTRQPASMEIPEPEPGDELALAGIAEDVDGEVTVRTAVISSPDGVFLVKAGDLLDGRFRVSSVSADAVDLVRLDDGRSLRLALRP